MLRSAREARLMSLSLDQLRLLRANYSPPSSPAIEKGDVIRDLLGLEASAFDSSTKLMLAFARNTGLEQGASPRRYLWTDAFAVTNFVELYFATQHEDYRAKAIALIDQVHGTLGRHRADDHLQRTGWLSGKSEVEGSAHPTSNGLRIGKKLPETSEKEASEGEDDWDRDGQYYHYATKWMHALVVVAQKFASPRYFTYAYEFAKGIHPKFVRGSRMYWKMSVDLSKPVVPSMGHHDPLDGFLTYSHIEVLRAKFASSLPSLTPEIGQLRAIMKGKDWATDDTLGLGGILCDIHRSYHLFLATNEREYFDLALTLAKAASRGLNRLTRVDRFDLPASRRLPFRELGLSIGLRAVAALNALLLNAQQSDRGTLTEADAAELRSSLQDLLKHQSLVPSIETFWLHESNQRGSTWTEHMDINTVMLATSLTPSAFLDFE